MHSQLIRFLPVLGVVFALGCSKNDVTGGDDGGVEEPPEVVYPEGLTLTWRIVNPGRVGEDTEPGQDARTFPPVVGAKVCVHERSDLPCTTTRSDGTFVIGGLKQLERIVITCEKDGYIGSLRTVETASTDMDGIASPILMGKDRDDVLDIGVTVERKKGAISIFAVSPDEDGGFNFSRSTKVSLSPKSGDGPFYTTDRNVFDRAATSMIGGLALYFNLEEGDYTVTFEDDHYDCAPVSFPFGQFGLPSPPHSVEVKVLNDFISDQVGILCTEKSVIVPDGG